MGQDTRKEQDRRQEAHFAEVGRQVGYLLHQLRSPLVTIGLAARSLHRRARLPEKDRERLRLIADQTDEMERMLENCLDFVRPMRERQEPVSVPSLVRWVAEAVEPQAEEAGVSLETDVADDLPTLVGNRDLLRQALQNVVENGIHAAGQPHGSVTLGARRTARSVVLEVADTGPGMPREEVEQAFEPFHTTKRHGTGLGLPLVRKIVEGHGGSVRLRSRPGHGTTITLRLPVPEAGRKETG